MPLERRQTEVKSLRELVAYLGDHPIVWVKYRRKHLPKFRAPIGKYSFERIHKGGYLEFLRFCNAQGECFQMRLGHGMKLEWSVRFFPGGFRYRFDDLVLTFFFERR